MTEEETSMTLVDHLEELRKRVLVILIALGISSAISFTFADRFIQFLTQPAGGTDKLVAIEVTENISVFMRVALLSGVIIAMPVIVYELLMFILPGLTSTEKRWVYLGVPMASLLFIGGVAFTFYVMLPAALPFLMDFLGIHTTPRVSSYINFVTSIMFWIGLSFEFPLLAFLLAKLKIISAGMLAKGWRVAIVAIAVIAAMVTPTVDPINMSILMAPLFVLYLFSILLAFLARRGES